MSTMLAASFLLSMKMAASQPALSMKMVASQPALVMKLAASQPASPSTALALPDAIRGDRYEALLGNPLGGRCNLPDMTWRVTAGNPPQGVAGHLAGIQGIPMQTGNYEFVLEASNECQKVAVPVRLKVRNRPIVVASRESISIDARAGGPDVLADPILVSSDWPDRPLAISSSEPTWLVVTPQSAATPAQGSALSAVPVAIRLRTAGMKAGVYRAVITVSSWRANAVEVPVTFTVREP